MKNFLFALAFMGTLSFAFRWRMKDTPVLPENKAVASVPVQSPEVTSIPIENPRPLRPSVSVATLADPSLKEAEPILDKTLPLFENLDVVEQKKELINGTEVIRSKTSQNALLTQFVKGYLRSQEILNPNGSRASINYFAKGKMENVYFEELPGRTELVKFFPSGKIQRIVVPSGNHHLVRVYSEDGVILESEIQ